MKTVTVMFVLVVFCLLGYLGTSQDGKGLQSETCEKMIAISNSDENIAYIKHWTKKALEDNKLLLRLGPSAIANTNLGIERFEKLQLDFDWEYLGITKKYAFLQLDGKVDASRDHMNPENIWSVIVGEGRDSVIVDIGIVPENSLNIRNSIGDIHISQLTRAIAWCR